MDVILSSQKEFFPLKDVVDAIHFTVKFNILYMLIDPIIQTASGIKQPLFSITFCAHHRWLSPSP